MVFQISNHALVHWLCLTGRVRRQEEQGHIFQYFHLGMGGAVVTIHFLFCLELCDPFHQDLACIPGFLVGVILRKELMLLKHLGFADLPYTNNGRLSVADMFAQQQR